MTSWSGNLCVLSLSRPIGRFIFLCLIGIVHLLCLFMKVHTSSAVNDVTGGALDKDTAANALLGLGAVVSCGWGLGSTIHTLVAAPATSLLAIGGSAAAIGSGIVIKANGKLDLKGVTFDTQAEPVAA